VLNSDGSILSRLELLIVSVLTVSTLLGFLLKKFVEREWGKILNEMHLAISVLEPFSSVLRHCVAGFAFKLAGCFSFL